LGASQVTNYYFKCWNNSKQLKNDPFFTLAEGKRGRGKEGFESDYCLGLGCFITLEEG